MASRTSTIVTDLRFMPAAQDRDRLPVALLSGFLGSGKTTLLNALLQDPRMHGTAVAINEFGAVPLDQHLIQHGDDQTVVMANGCLCCNLAGDLEEAVMRIFSRREAGAVPYFARLIVEPSGFADPAPIAQAILRNPVMSRVLRLDGIITVVDAVFGERQLAEHPECARQIALADRIVLTKTDLADPASLRQTLAARNPVAPVLEVRHGEIDPARLFSAHCLDVRTTPLPDLPAASGAAHHDHHHHHHGSDSEAIVLAHDAPLEWERLDLWLRRLRLGSSDHLLRLKGIVNIAGSVKPVVIHGVHHVMHPPVQLEAWPDADHRTRIVLILRGLDAGGVRAGWDELTASVS